MLKKFGFGSIIAGIFLLVFGIWMLNSSGPFSYLGYSSGMRTIMEFAPWIFTILGALGIIGGIFYITQEMKPMSKRKGKVIEKNGNAVVFEFEDGSRKSLTILGKIALVVGDTGMVGYKGNFVVEFNK